MSSFVFLIHLAMEMIAKPKKEVEMSPGRIVYSLEQAL